MCGDGVYVYVYKNKDNNYGMGEICMNMSMKTKETYNFAIFVSYIVAC